jgi:hypothetical protein
MGLGRSIERDISTKEGNKEENGAKRESKYALPPSHDAC